MGQKWVTSYEVFKETSYKTAIIFSEEKEEVGGDRSGRQSGGGKQNRREEGGTRQGSTAPQDMPACSKDSCLDHML